MRTSGRTSLVGFATKAARSGASGGGAFLGSVFGGVVEASALGDSLFGSAFASVLAGGGLLRSGGSTPSRFLTKKSFRRRSPYGIPPDPWPPPGTTINSKSLPALMRAFTTCMVDAGSTFRSNSPTVSSSLPVSRWASVTFDCSA